MLAKENPLVSLIIPCYNVSAYVEKAVKSILSQTYTNLEIIIVDDASTDDTVKIIKNIKDSRIKLLELKENTKKVGAVNAALEEVRGELIAFQDADDWSDTTRVEEQVKLFKDVSDLGICFTKYRYASKESVSLEKFALTDVELKDEFLNFGSTKKTHMAPTMCATMMITKEVLNETKGYHPYFAGRVAEDIHWVYRILKKNRGLTVNMTLYNVLQRKGSLTQNQFEGKNPKAAYSWRLLSKIIFKDIYENVDLLSPVFICELKETELKACEEILVEKVALLNQTRIAYESSRSYQLGKILLAPLRVFKTLRK
ncbi:glycosyltransferase family 2 protein [Pontibacter sp. MBLB2868]|uniref:glycosyltransferase family 2 protein n=1 Tax=Pontibacter sp. MBLB2868 TaxID=3451555 RepID=UPI003F754E2D